MYNKIKNLTMLLFVAATMFTFASCNKDDGNNGGSGSGGSSSISEAKLIVNGKDYISPDKDGHKGGVWKRAKTMADLNSKKKQDGNI